MFGKAGSHLWALFPPSVREMMLSTQPNSHNGQAINQIRCRVEEQEAVGNGVLSVSPERERLADED